MVLASRRGTGRFRRHSVFILWDDGRETEERFWTRAGAYLRFEEVIQGRDVITAVGWWPLGEREEERL